MIEILAAPALIAAPFLIGFGPVAGALSVALGAVLMGVAVSTATEDRSIPLSAHASFDYAIAALTLLTGLAAGLSGEEPAATAFLVGFGAAHMVLTASTRFSARGA